MCNFQEFVEPGAFRLQTNRFFTCSDNWKAPKDMLFLCDSFSSYLSTVCNISGCAFGKAAGWAKYVFKWLGISYNNTHDIG